METLSKTTHPLILVAAVSVSIASLAAAAHFTGLIPTKSETPPAAVVATAPVQAAPAIAAPVAAAPVAAAAPVPVEAAPAPVKKPVARVQPRRPAPVQTARYDEDSRYDAYNRRVSNNERSDNGIDVYPARGNQPPPVQQPPAPPLCHECGTVENVREIASQGEGSGLGAVAGGVLGGLLGNQTGRGKGKDAMTVLGALGGAFGGHQVEKMVRTEKQYEVTVRFDDGNVRTFSQTTPQWQSGSRVRLYNGGLVSL